MMSIRRFVTLFVVASISAIADADPLPKSDPAGAFPELKVLDAQGRPWRSARENWAGAKVRVASDPA